MITTLTQSLGTFAVVSTVFGLVFALHGIPVYLAFIFGGIALATAPAPALSIDIIYHKEYGGCCNRVTFCGNTMATGNQIAHAMRIMKAIQII